CGIEAIMGRILGLDVGRRRIGAALSDPDGILASPLGVIERQSAQDGLEQVCRWVRQHKVERIVVGYPLRLDGGEGEEAGLVRDWVARLQLRVDIPIELWDERLSSAVAERALLESGMRRERRRLERDAVAAALILQNYLDARRAGEPDYQTRQSNPFK
ncbi:MAG: Holliday junction resolvase RuvX, partial [Chloroflexia bacterium]